MLVDRDSWWPQTLTAPILVVVYAVAARRPSIPRMAIVAVAFACAGRGLPAGLRRLTSRAGMRRPAVRAAAKIS